MKNKKLMLVASLLSLVSLAGCDVESFCNIENLPSSSAPEQGGSSQGTSVATDIYGGVLPGLNTEAENKIVLSEITGVASTEGSTQTYSGEIAGYMADDHVAFGWAQYQIQEWYSTYGAAVKITFDDEGNGLSVSIGVPVEEAHNFTPSYAASAPDAYEDYLNNLQTNIEKLVIGKNAFDIALSLCDTTIVPEAEKQFVPADGNVLGTGATQTETRTEAAVLAAAAAWVSNDIFVGESYDTEIPTDPINNTVFQEVADHIATQTVPSSGPALSQAFKSATEENVYYAYTAYTSYGSLYGVALKATVEDKKITTLEFGVPAEGCHNFTPVYATTNFIDYLQYRAHYEDNFRDLVIGKDLSTIFTQAPSITVDTNSFIPNLFDSTIYAGETQSYTRGSLALYTLINSILAE